MYMPVTYLLFVFNVASTHYHLTNSAGKCQLVRTKLKYCTVMKKTQNKVTPMLKNLDHNWSIQ